MADPYTQSLVQDFARIGKGPMPSPAQMTQIASSMTGIGGLFDMAGMMPKMPDRKTTMLEMMREGERSPSLLQNLREENYLDAGLQLAGAIPVVGLPIKTASRLQRAKAALGDPKKYTPEEYDTRLRYLSGQFFDEDQKNLAESAVRRIADEGDDKMLLMMNVRSADDLRPDSIAFGDTAGEVAQVFTKSKAEQLLKQKRISPEEFEAISYQNKPRTAKYETQQNALLKEFDELEGIETLDPGKPLMKKQTAETKRENAALSRQMKQAGLPVQSSADAADIEPEIKEQLDIILDRTDPEG